MSRSEPTAVSVELVYQTEDAILVNDGTDRETWVPKSEILSMEGPTDDDGDYIVMASYDITIPLWLAEEKGLV